MVLLRVTHDRASPRIEYNLSPGSCSYNFHSKFLRGFECSRVPLTAVNYMWCFAPFGAICTI